MKTTSYILTPVLVIILTAGIIKLQAQDLPPIVSTGWLAENLDKSDLVLLDVRNAGNYNTGHIPGSVNRPAYPNWYVNAPMTQDLPWMELPANEDLFETIGEAGISSESRVVIIAWASTSSTEGPAEYGLTMASRVALTLIYAGVNKVAILDGGYDMWVDEGRAVTTEPAEPEPASFKGNAMDAVFISKEYVASSIGKSTIIDTRTVGNYYGTESDFSSSRAGHIPTATPLPAPWFWEETKAPNGEDSYLTWSKTDKVKEIARTVLGENLDVEIIDYCGVGGYASPVWFLLTRVAGYTNVKFYDGSMQEWTAEPDAPVTLYKSE